MKILYNVDTDGIVMNQLGYEIISEDVDTLTIKKVRIYNLQTPDEKWSKIPIPSGVPKEAEYEMVMKFFGAVIKKYLGDERPLEEIHKLLRISMDEIQM